MSGTHPGTHPLAARWDAPPGRTYRICPLTSRDALRDAPGRTPAVHTGRTGVPYRGTQGPRTTRTPFGFGGERRGEARVTAWTAAVRVPMCPPRRPNSACWGKGGSEVHSSWHSNDPCPALLFSAATFENPPRPDPKPREDPMNDAQPDDHQPEVSILATLDAFTTASARLAAVALAQHPTPAFYAERLAANAGGVRLSYDSCMNVVVVSVVDHATESTEWVGTFTADGELLIPTEPS